MICTVVHILSVYTCMTLAVIVLLFQLGTGDQSISKILWCRYKRREYVTITRRPRSVTISM